MHLAEFLSGPNKRFSARSAAKNLLPTLSLIPHLRLIDDDTLLRVVVYFSCLLFMRLRICSRYFQWRLSSLFWIKSLVLFINDSSVYKWYNWRFVRGWLESVIIYLVICSFFFIPVYFYDVLNWREFFFFFFTQTQRRSKNNLYFYFSWFHWESESTALPALGFSIWVDISGAAQARGIGCRWKRHGK